MKVMFMGTPDFAVPSLEALCEKHEVVAVVTAPDKPRNRMEMTPTPVGECAARLGLRTEKPETLRDGAILPLLEETAPDVIAVAAYGKILPGYVLDFPRYGCINVHGSLLPRYRGAAPMQRAIMDGVPETGVTIMRMDRGLDTGEIFEKSAVALDPDADFEWVHDTLARLGAEALLRVLDDLQNGRAVSVPQDEALATYAAKITKEECALDFAQSAASLHDRIRALSPFPLAFAFCRGKMIKIIRTVRQEKTFDAAPGTVTAVDPDAGFTVACGVGSLLVTAVLPEGKRRMSASDFLRGRGIAPGDVLTSEK